MSTISSIINNDEPEISFGVGTVELSVGVPDVSSDRKENGMSNENAPAPPPAETDSSGKISQQTILASFERIKTHFPAARIKKIMQSDDEIGKVAQATPVIVGRALEIFMTNLVEAAIVESKKQGVKRISASHIRAAVENTEQFDFLVEAVDKYPPLKH